MIFKRFLLAAAIATGGLTAWALPTVDAVQAEVQRGHYAQAEVMMQDVVAAKPGSARAHYVYAEILAHNAQFDQAAQQLARARQIDPAIGYTDPARFSSLEQLLARELAARNGARTTGARSTAPLQAMAPAQPSGGVPAWAWALGLGGAAALAWTLFRRRPPVGVQAQASPAGAYRASGYAAPYAMAPTPGYPQASTGSGMLGVGLAAAGGLAAGMLAEKLLHGGHDSAAASASSLPNSGGLVPGMFDDASSDDALAAELRQRQVDFGSGDGWGGDSADGGTAFNDGGNGDDGGW